MARLISRSAMAAMGRSRSMPRRRRICAPDASCARKVTRRCAQPCQKSGTIPANAPMSASIILAIMPAVVRRVRAIWPSLAFRPRVHSVPEKTDGGHEWLQRRIDAMAAKRRVLITGGGKGVGRATALRLAREGAAVAVLARTRADVEAVAREIEAAGGRAA